MNNLRATGVVIDAGHGGNDPGAVNGNTREKDFNLKVSQIVALVTVFLGLFLLFKFKNKNKVFNN